MAYRGIPLVFALMVSLAGCASTSAGPERTRNFDRSVLTRDDLARRPAENMYTIVSSMRSDWLRPALSGSGVAERTASAPPTVYVDGRLFGSLDLLKSFSPESVDHVRYYSATAAQNRFGTAVASPVIELVSRGRAARDTSAA